MHELYEELIESRDEKKLLTLIQSGKVKVTDADKQMQTPLMFAVQYNFSEATISELIDLGSDVNGADGDGMTCLHHSFYCNEEDSTMFKLLVSKGADPDKEDAEGESSRTLIEGNPKYKNALEIVEGADMAVSISKSQFEAQEAKA